MLCCILYGEGGEGKSLFNCSLARAIWGSGFGYASGSILQRELEFQRQGHLLTGKAWVALDEIQRGTGLVEEAYKLFCEGGRLMLRRNHEAETHYASWECAAKTWCGNTRDIPYVPGAFDVNFARRTLCVRMESCFAFEPAKIDVARRVFPAKSGLRPFLSSPEAGMLYWRHFLIPFLQRTTKQACLNMLEKPHRGIRSGQNLVTAQDGRTA